MRILFVKLTSMGDLIHALPAITDATKAIPTLSFDWVIDKNFSEVAQWHPAIKTIITTAHRRWRKNLWQALSQGEIQHFLKSLRQERYDIVIDGQTNTKSAFVTMLARGTRHGLDKNSARERIAHLAYQKHYAIDKNLHAITRLRMLFAQVFNYPYRDTQPDYGIANHAFPSLPFALPKPYVYFVHNASWSTKLWPEMHWHQLIDLAAKDGLNVVLPWGNAEEKTRAEIISRGHGNATVLPFCTLSQHAQILKESQGAICSDTGLSHLAAALNVPAITLYGPTSVKLIGTTGLNQQHMLPDFPCIECYKVNCNYGGQLYDKPQCLMAIKPEDIWTKFKNLSNL